MNRFRSISIAWLFVPLAIAGCARAKSANPLSPDIAGPIPGVSISAPKPLEPGQGSEVVRNGPMTLLIENASTSGQRAVYLQVQVAADTNFTQLVHHAERVEPGPNGRTSYRLPEELGAGRTYFWRLRAADGANSSPYSSTWSFSVIDPVVMEPPTPLEPAGAIPTNRPVFRVRNGKISGTTSAYYRFELATAPDVNAIVAVVTTTPGPNGETTMSVGDLPYGRTFFWRVHASDGTTQSSYSALVSFTTPPPTVVPVPPPAPGPAPPGTAPTVPSIPADCGPLGPGNRSGCVAAVAAQSANWLGCQRGNGVSCHRFTREVAFALSRSDANWKMIMAAPGGNACNCSGCGPSDGSMFREDTMVYGGNTVFDIIAGAGGPSPSLQWNVVPGPRPGDIPNDAPLCVP